MILYSFLRRGALALRAVEVALTHAKFAVSNTADNVAVSAKEAALSSIEKRIERIYDDLAVAASRKDTAHERFYDATLLAELDIDDALAKREDILNEVL